MGQRKEEKRVRERETDGRSGTIYFQRALVCVQRSAERRLSVGETHKKLQAGYKRKHTGDLV